MSQPFRVFKSKTLIYTKYIYKLETYFDSKTDRNINKKMWITNTYPNLFNVFHQIIGNSPCIAYS
jgi:hypothetical protein